MFARGDSCDPLTAGVLLVASTSKATHISTTVLNGWGWSLGGRGIRSASVKGIVGLRRRIQSR